MKKVEGVRTISAEGLKDLAAKFENLKEHL
jgi:hypothetical protein